MNVILLQDDERYLYSGSMSPGPVLDFIDVPLEGIEGLGNRVEVQAVAKAIVLAGLKETDPAKKEQLDDASMGAALAADNVGINNELDMKDNTRAAKLATPDGVGRPSVQFNPNSGQVEVRRGTPVDLKLPGMLGSANLPEVTIHLLHADTAFATPISHCGDDEHEGKVDQFANYAFEVVPSAHIDIATFEEKGLKKATLGATEPTDTICLVFKAIGSCRKNEGNLAASRRWILRLETGREQHDIKLQVFTTLKNTERLIKDRKRRGDEVATYDADSRVDENDNREKKMKKCLELYRMELQAMPNTVLDWELKKLNSHGFECKNTK